jgi:hypothetical protein
MRFKCVCMRFMYKHTFVYYSTVFTLLGAPYRQRDDRVGEEPVGVEKIIIIDIKRSTIL